MIHFVHTRSVVLTRMGRTLIDVHVTVIALISRHTEALVAISSVPADGSVLTGLRLAFVYVGLTRVPLVPGSTLTPEPGVGDIDTDTTVLTYPF